MNAKRMANPCRHGRAEHEYVGLVVLTAFSEPFRNTQTFLYLQIQEHSLGGLISLAVHSVRYAKDDAMQSCWLIIVEAAVLILNLWLFLISCAVCGNFFGNVGHLKTAQGLMKRPKPAKCSRMELPIRHLRCSGICTAFLWGAANGVLMLDFLCLFLHPSPVTRATFGPNSHCISSLFFHPIQHHRVCRHDAPRLTKAITNHPSLLWGTAGLLSFCSWMSRFVQSLSSE